MNKIIAIGSDHAGVGLKNIIKDILTELGIEALDYGTDKEDSVDYPDFGEKVSEAVSSGRVERGILICGTGLGMSIVANKFPNVRATTCHDTYTAKMSRLHNDSNILVMGSRVIGRDTAAEIVRIWIETPFEGGRHIRRLEKISRIEERNFKNR
jgi:ribose 5-phosphate isomerase B